LERSQFSFLVGDGRGGGGRAEVEWLWLPSVQHASKGSESAQELSSKKPCRCCGTPSVSVAITATRFDGKRPRDKESSQHRVRVQLVHQALHPSSAVQCSSICLVWGNEREAAALEFLINRSRSLIAQASNRRETRTEKKILISRGARGRKEEGALTLSGRAFSWGRDKLAAAASPCCSSAHCEQSTAED
jgi:hypothetical protein